MSIQSKCKVRTMFSFLRQAPAEKESKNMDHALWGAERIPPRSTPLLRTGQGVHQEFFDKTLWMQPYLNRRSADRWCFDEQDTTTCTLFTYDQPATGRSFEVRFGARRLGTLEVQSDYDGICLALRIHFVNRLSFDDLFGLVSMLAISVKGDLDTEFAKSAAAIEANTALLRCLWDSSQSEGVATLECKFSGTADHFREWTKHWEANGIDPWRKWAGDR